jgi:carboxypeptidase C (cathepsin A)
MSKVVRPSYALLPPLLALSLLTWAPTGLSAQPHGFGVRIMPVTIPAQAGPVDPKATPAPEPQEKTSVTHHTIRVGGQPVAYTATTGTLVLRDDNGKALASFFYVYYARDGVTDLAKRPIFYSFNGGPGTASIWMHVGFTAPRRVTYDDDGFMVRPPFAVSDNDQSIIDVADIVYIDPVGTGFSRMAQGQDPHRFHGISEDIAAMGDFIRVFTTRQNRWKSPKYLIGESYGTTRASGLANYLQSAHQMYLNGVILVSMTELGVTKGVDTEMATTLPYMTATAWYHKRLPADLQAKPLKVALAESEAYALRDYLFALSKGGLIGADETAATAKQVARLTGLSPEFVLRCNLRVDLQRFWKELLRDKGLIVGRLDSRYTGVDRDNAGESPEGDPAMWHWDGPFAGALHTYLRDELKWETDDKYYVWGNVYPWKEEPDPHVGELLRQAMTQNPYLHVMILEGYYDGACDYFSAQHTISHLDPSGGLNARFHFAFYESGHMMYLKNSALAKAKQDIVEFMQQAMGSAR